MAYYTGGETSVTIGRTADYVSVFRVTPGFFEALGARAAIGRLLSDEEQKPGGPLAVVITDAFWRRQFNADPKAIGATVKFSDRVFTIAGVLERDIRFPAPRRHLRALLDPSGDDVAIGAQLSRHRATAATASRSIRRARR